MKFGDLICYRFYVTTHDFPVMYLGRGGAGLVWIMPLTSPFRIVEKAEEAWQLCTHFAPYVKRDA